MPLSKIKDARKEAPRRSSFQNSPLYNTEEWITTVKRVEHMKPYEWFEVLFTKETIADIPLQDPISAFYVALRRYLKRRKLPVDVQLLNKRTEPTIQVAGRSAHIA